jgi:serine/threonine-protein kinase
MQLAPETRLGPYEITALLGTGGTGEVYKAVDTRLKRNVAIKMLKGPDAERLEREARVIAKLSHPGVCAIYDVGDNYIVMEYVEGSPVRGPLPLNDCLSLAGQIANALEAAHGQGVVHRDLKPANILVKNGCVKLLDFGHAKQLSSNPGEVNPDTLEGTAVGTAGYMSPEQVQGKPIDSRSDVFSFGIVLYELISGKRAFPGDVVLDVLNAIVHDEPPPLETAPELQKIVASCLKKDPAQRLQSMTEVKQALGRVKLRKPKQPSIAVLPFVNLSGDTDNDYFCEGLTEELINQIAQIPGLKVTARTSVFAFEKRTEDIRKIAQTLDVQTLLEGSVRQSGSQLRITAQLINAADGYHLWSKTYDREKANIFEVQDDISGAIAKSLQLRLYHGRSVSLSAYEAYLKARYYLWKLTGEGLAQSREYYEQAIAIDPDFALAHCGYAEYFLARAIRGLMPADEALPAARASARQALDIDPALCDAHAVLGSVAVLHDLDWDKAKREFELAEREIVSPALRVLHAYYYLLPWRRIGEAVREVERALRDDPLNATLHRIHGVCLSLIGRSTDATREFHEALELDNQSTATMTMLALDYWTRGMQVDALVWAERAYSLLSREPISIGLYSGILASTGDATRARQVRETLGDGQSYGSPAGLTLFHLLVEEIDEAASWFVRLVQQRHLAGAFLLLHSPVGGRLSSSDRWPELAGMLNLPAKHTVDDAA